MVVMIDVGIIVAWCDDIQCIFALCRFEVGSTRRASRVRLLRNGDGDTSAVTREDRYCTISHPRMVLHRGEGV